MMYLWKLCVVVSSIALVISAASTTTNQALGDTRNGESYFFLRAHSQNDIWDGQRLVALPRSHQLGIENSTVQPSTPPLKFHPIQLANGKYALEGESVSDEESLVPYLAARDSTTGTRTASMFIVYTADPAQIDPEACPQGYKCVADQWTLGAAGEDGVYPDFGYAGYRGKWAPFQDAGVEGWHVYWKGDAGNRRTIGLELEPVTE